MAEIIKFEDLTLNVEEARGANEMIFEDIYARPEIEQVHGIQLGVDMDKRIPILGQFGLLGKLDQGGCAINNETDQIPVSQKTWTPKLISGRLTHCQDDIPNLLKVWKKSMIAKGIWETVDNEMVSFIEARVANAITESILQKTSFGNTAAEVVGAGGYLTAGTDNDYFTPLNGIWEQIFIDQSGPALIKRYKIDENSGTSKEAQLELAPEAALNAMRYMYNNIDPRAFSGNLVMQLSRTLFTNWINFLESKSLVHQLDRIENGASKFSYRLIPIVVRYDWDRNILAYHDLGTTYYLPHRAILSDINNIPIGTSDKESFTTFDSFYDKFTKKWYVDYAYRLDAKILQENLIAVAY